MKTERAMWENNWLMENEHTRLFTRFLQVFEFIYLIHQTIIDTDRESNEVFFLEPIKGVHDFVI